MSVPLVRTDQTQRETTAGHPKKPLCSSPLPLLPFLLLALFLPPSAPAATAGPQDSPADRNIYPKPPDIRERISLRYPNGLAEVPVDVRERGAVLQALRDDARSALRGGDSDAAWTLVREFFDDPDDPESSDLGSIRLLMYLGHRARFSGEDSTADTAAALVRDKIEDRLNAPALRSGQPDARADRAKWILTLGRVHERLLNESAAAALLYDEARRLDPGSRQGIWALERLGRKHGRAGYRAYESLVPDPQSLPPRVRAILQATRDE